MFRNEEVLRCYRDALQAQPDFPETYNNLASHLQALGRLDEAIRAYREFACMSYS
jgi:tetratricopeptide (TPR) repeat protein